LSEGESLITEPSKFSSKAISEYAEYVGKFHDIYDSTGRADLDQLLEKLGGVVDVSDSFVATESLSVRGIGDFTIHLPAMTSSRRDRFTTAHELGHYFLHYRQPNLQGAHIFYRGGQGASETQANVFAASLLMPSEQFAAAKIEVDADAWALAARFGVSPRAAEVRLQVLGS
jgi:Zn-dependent peptidase ImmA (M78 family)